MIGHPHTTTQSPPILLHPPPTSNTQISAPWPDLPDLVALRGPNRRPDRPLHHLNSKADGWHERAISGACVHCAWRAWEWETVWGHDCPPNRAFLSPFAHQSSTRWRVGSVAMTMDWGRCGMLCGTCVRPSAPSCRETTCSMRPWHRGCFGSLHAWRSGQLGAEHIRGCAG